MKRLEFKRGPAFQERDGIFWGSWEEKIEGWWWKKTWGKGAAGKDSVECCQVLSLGEKTASALPLGPYLGEGLWERSFSLFGREGRPREPPHRLLISFTSCARLSRVNCDPLWLLGVRFSDFTKDGIVRYFSKWKQNVMCWFRDRSPTWPLKREPWRKYSRTVEEVALAAVIRGESLPKICQSV